MRSDEFLLAAGVAGLTAVLALFTRGQSISYVAATISAAAASVLLLRTVLGTSARPQRPTPVPPPPAMEVWLQSGTIGREEIVRHLDRLDRMGPNPGLGVRSEADLEEIRGYSAPEFFEYVSRRLTDIEGPS